MRDPVILDTPHDLGPAAVLSIADGSSVVLGAGLLDRVTLSRQATLRALAAGGAVYGVSTGMGDQSHLAVGTGEQPAFQDDLMLARSVGGAPWLGRREVRAAVAARLRTLLEPEAGASPALAAALVGVLEAGLLPAVPATGNGAAGEIIPLAHLGAFLTGRGEGLDAAGAATPAGFLLRGAGLAPYGFGGKEGVAFLQGVPVATAQTVLLADDTRLLAAQALTAAAGEIALCRAPRDPYSAALARGDDALATVLAALRDLVGDEPGPRMLQAPVSFRVVGPALAHLLRSAALLDAAAMRALDGVSTSPALVEGRFLGTSGFDGFDLAAAADGVRLSALHVAEVGAARMHRLLDPRVTGLPPQLSAAPGRQAGMVAVHKRAVGLLHEARRTSAPASLGASETSLGQEDVQSFALEATRAAQQALGVLRDVTACELVVLHQGTQLDDTGPRGSQRLQAVLRKAFELLPQVVDDRPTGREVTALSHVLGVGWAHDLLG
ncbi:MAG: aromatic amino acid lyase [Nocardioidaceae bacterium]